MKKRFWYPVIQTEADARTASLWSLFGYVWIGGANMLLALLNSAGWMNTQITPEGGILVGIYAAVFGWLTWRRSYIGTLIGFVLFVAMTIVGLGIQLSDGHVPSGSWAIVAQGMLLLSGVRAARFAQRERTRTKATVAQALAATVEAGSADNPRLHNPIQFCPSCSTKVFTTPSGLCPQCRNQLA